MRLADASPNVSVRALRRYESGSILEPSLTKAR